MLLNVPDEKDVCRQVYVFRAINRALITLANEDQSSENKLVITEEFIFDQNKLSKDPNNHFNMVSMTSSSRYITSAGVTLSPALST